MTVDHKQTRAALARLSRSQSKEIVEIASVLMRLLNEIVENNEIFEKLENLVRVQADLVEEQNEALGEALVDIRSYVDHHKTTMQSLVARDTKVSQLQAEIEQIRDRLDGGPMLN